MLHLTNGSCAVALLRAAGMHGDIVAWDDVLHEGPVEAGLSPAAMRARRASFLAGCGWGSIEEIGRSLAIRDGFVERAAEQDEIVLWFEHDLYDQLQLLQILDLLPFRLSPPITMPPVPTYIGHLDASQIAPLFAARAPLSGAQRSDARDAWTAFCASDPRLLVDVARRVNALPSLGPALVRHLEQFPSVANGLSRTEQQALAAIAKGTTRMADVYRRAHHEREEALFMGDLGFLLHVGALFQTAHPLLEKVDSGPVTLDTQASLTSDGERVLAGTADRVALSGIDRWLGGVHVAGHGPVWRWNGHTVVRT